MSANLLSNRQSDERELGVKNVMMIGRSLMDMDKDMNYVGACKYELGNQAYRKPKQQHAA